MRIGVISDIHSNLAALDAVLADIGSVDAIWCLGDVVGYAAEPNECVERLRELSALCVAGNHDWAALGRLSVEDFNPDAARAAIWTAQQLTAEARAWLGDRPQVAVEGLLTLAHGSPCDPLWEYVVNSRIAARCLTCFDTLGCLIGHTHIPSSFVEQPDGTIQVEYREAGDVVHLEGARLLANPGSVGQPRDEDPRAAYLTYDTDTGRLAWRRTAYPVAVTQEKITRAGLPAWLARRLAAGR